jgi:hypothetical protein
VSLDGQPYWAAAREGRLLFQRCRGCGAAVWQPRAVCPECLAGELAWEESRGQGTVYSFSTVHRAPTAAWAAKVPYTLGIVQLREGYYLFSEIVGPPDLMQIGAAVTVWFDRLDDEVTLPKFILDGPGPGPGEGTP